MSGAAILANSTMVPGACQAQGCTMVVTGCTFAGIKALDGGAVLVRSNELQVNVTDSQFTGSAATSGSGGAVRVTAQTSARPNTVVAMIRNCTFVSNFAKKDGGAVFFENVARASVNNCSMTNNTAQTGVGGALAMLSVCNVPPRGASLVGAAAMHTFDCRMEVDNTVMDNNHAGSSAGKQFFALHIHS